MISLKHTINGLLDSPRFSSALSILESALAHTEYLGEAVERLNGRQRLDAVECEIRDCAHKLEDVLEFHELSKDHEYEDEEVRHEVISFTEEVKKMIEDLSSSPETDDDDDDDDAAASSSYIDYGVEMVGRFEETENVRDELVSF